MRIIDTIVLASASPRRAALLASAGVRVTVLPSGIGESRRPGEPPERYVRRLAGAKARDAASKAHARFFIGADTIVLAGGAVLEKPADVEEAARMLRRLSGQVHDVLTGYEVYDRTEDRAVGGAVSTRVRFKALSDEEIEAYVATGEPLDKAGAYGVQEGAAYMVEQIDGSYTNVVGLPLTEVVEALVRLGAVAW
ncbi:MAG TPA: Maf family nucleotide pyrophosphatase [bacterium]|nr:Maf family nucleotide pyrophosphatase [bacterium]